VGLGQDALHPTDPPTGTGCLLQASASVVPFGDVSVFVDAPVEHVGVQNVGDAACTLNATLVGGAGAGFSLGAGFVNVDVEPGAIADLLVHLTPLSVGNLVGSALVFDVNGGLVSITLTANASPDPTTTPPAPHACRGATWTVRNQLGDHIDVGSDNNTDAYNGDTSCAASLPVLCLRPEGLPLPSDITPDFYNGWSGGEVALTDPVLGSTLTSPAVANALCASTFGPGFRMGEHHDGGGGWGWWALGSFAQTRMWVTVNDQNSSPWKSN
jgi:hypothetical protein